MQTYKNLEIIVVDDASPDDCAAIAQRDAASDRRIRVIRRAENGGVLRAFNTGYEASLGSTSRVLPRMTCFGKMR